MSHAFCHLQLNTPNAKRARQFYADLFNWKMNAVQMPEGEYTMIAADDGPGGGIRANGSDAMPSQWLSYVSVPDASASTALARKLGATVIQDVTAVDGMGRFAILADPTGAAFGIWEDA